LLDESIAHRDGHEIHYVAARNYAAAADVQRFVRRVIEDNKIQDTIGFLALVQAASLHI